MLNEESIMNALLSQLGDLSLSEKLLLVEDLWDDIAASPESLPIHPWQQEELARREASLAANPEAAMSWEEAKRRIRSGDA